MKIIAVSGWAGSGKDTIAEYLIRSRGFKRAAFADVLKDMVADQYKIDRQSLDDRARKERALLHMPVAPKDAYSKMIAEYLIKEFRSTQGKRPTGYTYVDGEFYGTFDVLQATGEDFDPKLHQGRDVMARPRLYRVYWTPRALAILEGSTKRSANSNYWVDRVIDAAIEESEAGGNGLYVISDARYKNEIDRLRSKAPGSILPIRVNRFETTVSTDSSERDLDDYQFRYTINNSEKEGKTLAQLYDAVDQILIAEGILDPKAQK